MPEVITQKLTADEDLLAIKTEGTETKESIEVDEISSAETNNVNDKHQRPAVGHRLKQAGTAVRFSPLRVKRNNRHVLNRMKRGICWC